MNNIDGLVFLLNQAGLALAQANAEIDRLRAELAAATTSTATPPRGTVDPQPVPGVTEAV